MQNFKLARKKKPNRNSIAKSKNVRKSKENAHTPTNKYKKKKNI